jgi:hypothetical protein
LDHDHIKAQEVISRYAAERLSENDETAFEAHLVDCPECIEAVESEMALRDGLRSVGSRPVAQPARPAAFRAPRARPAVFALQAAAAILLAVSVGLGLWLSRSTAERDAMRTDRDQLQRRAREAEQSVQTLERQLSARAASADSAPSAPRAEPVAPVAVIALATERGSSSIGGAPTNQVQIEKAARLVVFSVELPPASGTGQYDVVLKDAAGRILWRGGPFPPSSPDSLGLSVDRALLRDGDYVLELSRRSPAGTASIGRYTFRIVVR